MSMKRTLIASLSGACLSAACMMPMAAEATMPHTSQSIILKSGWSAVYVEVASEKTADELFAAWPVDHVSLYDPASFLATRQFSSDWSSQGLSREAMAVWYRDTPEASTLKHVPAGSVLVTFNKNASQFLDTLVSAPAAPRTTWHVTGDDVVYNFVGFSVSQADTDIAAYLEGSPCANVKSLAYYSICGDDPAAAPKARELRTWNSTVSDGDVLLLPSDTVSDWSGVLHISPLNGVNFGQTGTMGKLAIRNDGTTNRTVCLKFVRPLNAEDLFNTDYLPTAVHFRDADLGGWWNQVVPWNNVCRKELAAGETWNIEFGLDRSELQQGDRRKGLPFGFLVNVNDETSPAHAKAVIPVQGETSGEPADGWERGLWVADVEFDTIRLVDLTRTIESNEVNGVQVVTTNVVETSLSEATKTGGKFKVRFPVHRDENGVQRLLQRVVVSGNVAEDGSFSYKLYGGKAEPPSTDKTLMRISAVCLPTESPAIEASPGSRIWDWWTDSCVAKFDFTVAGDGATSLLRHPYHPQHDGLRWDFKALAPDGDDVFNYKGDVKPETFSVKNEITLTYAYGENQGNWNPVYEFSGMCEWRLTGLRHDGIIVISGPMVIKRVSPVAKLTLK